MIFETRDISRNGLAFDQIIQQKTFLFLCFLYDQNHTKASEFSKNMTLASEPKQCWEASGGIWEAPGRHLEASGEAWATMGDQGG